MIFEKIEPLATLKGMIKCYWYIEDDDITVVRQKIIPDGYPEIIFHSGDPYQLLLGKRWLLQDNYLLAGQLTSYFFLENTGKTSTFGIKFQPAALAQLFNLNMADYVDKVVALDNFSHPLLKPLKLILSNSRDFKSTSKSLNQFFEKLVPENMSKSRQVEQAVRLIFEKNGMITNSQLCQATLLKQRQMLNQFRKFIGISPKLYSRIIRLSYIFSLVQHNNEKWTSLAYEAAYFDQAHFIKDFKFFTGEAPGKYAFDENNLANFFLMPASKLL